MENLEELVQNYVEAFGEFPFLPIGASYSMIADLISDAIVSKVPVSPEEVWQRIEDRGEPLDLVK